MSKAEKILLAVFLVIMLFVMGAYAAERAYSASVDQTGIAESDYIDRFRCWYRPEGCVA